MNSLLVHQRKDPAMLDIREPKNKPNEITTTVGAAKAEDLAPGVIQNVQDVAAAAAKKAQDAAANLADKAQVLGSTALDKTNEGIAGLGHQMSALAGTVRQAASSEGRIGSAATTLADNLDAGGQYLEQNRLQDMGQDLTKLVRDYPVQAILIGFGLGCLIGTLLKRR
jgi:ElaB/YqjD/DUF883 family membrane-anchored ribosome-binding protein